MQLTGYLVLGFLFPLIPYPFPHVIAVVNTTWSTQQKLGVALYLEGNNQAKCPLVTILSTMKAAAMGLNLRWRCCTLSWLSIFTWTDLSLIPDHLPINHQRRK